ncbi:MULTISPECIES: CYTH domain-containing protein [Gracilibacillus]|uniref:CYTH domain-containing protein n=1 Tax=Gracilibacillus TaxID=74385 RepID=UPI0008245B80|nr:MULTISPECIES: CYTH domain-containing protein [Gracilibacillus]
MTKEIEIEFKNIITKNEYQSLMEHFPSCHWQRTLQKNYYFETNDFALKAYGSALRIREKEHTFQLTLKTPNPDGDGLLEVHASLTRTEAQQWINGSIQPKEGVSEALLRMGIHPNDLYYGGMLQTERFECSYKETNLVLDKSQYNGVLDYELEVEADSKAYGESIFQDILQQLDIPKRKTDNKIARFYQTLSSNQ